jgi:hypothetical protein
MSSSSLFSDCPGCRLPINECVGTNCLYVRFSSNDVTWISSKISSFLLWSFSHSLLSIFTLDSLSCFASYSLLTFSIFTS